MRLYLITSPTYRDTYVFAAKNDDAASIYIGHRIDMGQAPPQFMLDRLDNKRPWKADPKLKSALSRNIEGVGEREPGKGNWAILDKGAALALAHWRDSFNPPRVAKMTFAVTITVANDELVIFARTGKRALAINLNFITILDKLPDRWSGREWSNYRAHGDPAQLEAVLGTGVEGLGLYDIKRGWTVAPMPDDLDEWHWGEAEE
jgi:hypothetical protein